MSKVRSGFVSNSSSSSFVLFGWALPGEKLTDEQWDEREEKINKCNAGTVTEGTHPEGKYLLGYMISGEDYDFPEEHLSTKEITERVELIRKEFNVPLEWEWEVFTGTRSC